MAAETSTDETSLLEAIRRLEARLDSLERDADPGGQSEVGSPQERLAEVAEAVTDYIEAHPVRSALLAFLLGLLVASARR